MYCVLSPAKTLRSECDYQGVTSELQFAKETAGLARLLKKMTAKDLSKLMSISDKLAKLNYERYQSFQTQAKAPSSALPAAFLFQGDVYRHLDVDSLTQAEVTRLQKNVGILSGLYGLLRPLDLCQPYRLEMGTALPNPAGKDLYPYWRDKVTQAINDHMKKTKSKLFVNLASKEYASVICFKELSHPIIDIDFKTNKAGVLKTIGLQAKRARGAMARFIVQQRCETAKDLSEFHDLGFRFRKALSTDAKLVFVKGA